MQVDILDIGSGNVQSIKNWVEKANVTANVITKATDIKSDLLILPGVGSVGSYMERLRSGRFDKAVFEHVDNGGRLLGICLGFQIMSKYSEEDGGVEGLNLINGCVHRLEGSVSHNSWEPFYLNRSEMEDQALNQQYNLTKKRILNGRVFYNHEYGFVNQDKSAFSIPVSGGLSKYSGFLVKDKLIGIQFHPEKSQITGTELISMIL
tara:strand:- start:9656 stop:10276 length:621 start_codon:yes stop_codon:yes gene_type:complete